MLRRNFLSTVSSLAFLGAGSNALAWQAKPLKVTYVMSPGWTDQSELLSSLKTGFARSAKQFNLQVRYLPSQGVETLYYEVSEELKKGQTDILVCMGYEFAIPVLFLSRQFPQVKFGIFGVPMNDIYPNIYSTIFANVEGGFLCGALSSLFLKEKIFRNVGSRVGWIGGVDNSESQEFLTGFLIGARYITPDIEVLTPFVNSYTDPETARLVALDLYSKGVGIIMNYAADSGLGILRAAKECGKYVIGIDVDQDELYPGHVVTSMIKRYDRAIFLMMQQMVKGRVHNTGLMNLANYGIDFTQMAVLKRYHGPAVANQLYGKLYQLRRAVIAGTIQLPYASFYNKVIIL